MAGRLHASETTIWRRSDGWSAAIAAMAHLARSVHFECVGRRGNAGWRKCRRAISARTRGRCRVLSPLARGEGRKSLTELTDRVLGRQAAAEDRLGRDVSQITCSEMDQDDVLGRSFGVDRKFIILRGHGGSRRPGPFDLYFTRGTERRVKPIRRHAVTGRDDPATIEQGSAAAAVDGDEPALFLAGRAQRRAIRYPILTLVGVFLGCVVGAAAASPDQYWCQRCARDQLATEHEFPFEQVARLLMIDLEKRRRTPSSRTSLNATSGATRMPPPIARQRGCLRGLRRLRNGWASQHRWPAALPSTIPASREWPTTGRPLAGQRGANSPLRTVAMSTA